MVISPLVLQILLIVLVLVAIIALVYVTAILVRVNRLLARVEKIVAYADRLKAIIDIWESIPRLVITSIKDIVLSFIPHSDEVDEDLPKKTTRKSKR